MENSVKELTNLIKSGFERRDFESALKDCKRLNELKPDYSRGWWFTVLAENKAGGSKELATNGADLCGTESYENALKFATEEEKAKYEKVAKAAASVLGKSNAKNDAETTIESEDNEKINEEKFVSEKAAGSRAAANAEKKSCAEYAECLALFNEEQERAKEEHKGVLLKKQKILSERQDCLMEIKKTSGKFYAGNFFVFLLKTFYLLFPFLAAAVIMKFAKTAEVGVYCVLAAGVVAFLAVFAIRVVKYLKNVTSEKVVSDRLDAAAKELAETETEISEIRAKRKKLKKLTAKLNEVKTDKVAIAKLKKKFDSVCADSF